jgi:outer membrane protein assembly factor BamB
VTPGGAALLVLSFLLVACESRREQDWREGSALGETWPAPDGELFATQLPNGDVVAISSGDGNLLWRYQHVSSPEHPLIEFPRARLVCAPAFGSADVVYLLFADTLLGLSSSTGTVQFRMPLRNAPPRNACPAVAPDSSLVMLVQRGRALAKIAPAGTLTWSFQFPDGLVAQSGPMVVPSTGDVLVRTGPVLLNVSPSGTLNWQRLP